MDYLLFIHMMMKLLLGQLKLAMCWGFYFGTFNLICCSRLILDLILVSFNLTLGISCLLLWRHHEVMQYLLQGNLRWLSF